MLDRRVALAISPTAALILVLLLMWFTIPHVLVLNPDSFGYLGPSLSALSDLGFSHHYARAFVYPLVIYASIWAFGTLAGVIYVQMACYQITLLLLLRLLWLGAGKCSISLRITGALSFAMALVYFSYAPLGALTHVIGTEILCTFAGVLAASTLVLAFARRTGGIVFGALMAASLYTSWANVLIRPQWLVAAIVLTLVWSLVLLRSGLHTRSKIVLAVAVGTAIVTTLVVPEQHLVDRYEGRAGRLWGPRTLFCNHADIIVRASDADPRFWDGEPPVFVAQIMAELRDDIKSPEGWPLNGFNGDLCLYSANQEQTVRNRFEDDVARMRIFYLSTFFKAIVAEPTLYMSKIARQMTRAAEQPFSAPDLRLEARPEGMPERTLHPALERLYPETSGSVMGYMQGILPGVARFTRACLLNPLNGAPWLVTVALLLGYACAVARAPRISLPLNTLFGVGVMLIAWFSESMTVALSHTFDITRYLWIGAPFILGAMFLALQAAIDVTLQKFILARCKNDSYVRNSSSVEL